jgi:tetratricopeptide (TPR) repeat protein
VAADHYKNTGNHPAAMSFLGLAISTGSPKWQSKALNQLAAIKRRTGDYSGAQADAWESQRMAKIAGNVYLEASAVYTEAICWKILGSYIHSSFLLGRATSLLDLCGMSGSDMHFSIRISQAETHRHKSEYMEAYDIQSHGLQQCSADHMYWRAILLLNISQIAVEIGGAGHDVQQNLNTASELFQKINHSHGQTSCDMIRAALEVKQGNLLAGRKLFQECLRTAWGNQTTAVTYCLERLGSVQLWGVSDQTSFLWTVTFLVHSFKCKRKLELHKSLQFLGDLVKAQGDQETATSLFTVALDGFTHMDVHRSRAECMVRLGDISKLSGDEHKAVELWHTAVPLFERSSQRRQLADLHVKIAGLSYNQQ